MMPKTEGFKKFAIINGQEVEYNGITAPECDLAQAKRYYPEDKYEYLGKGYHGSYTQLQHFFKRKEQQQIAA